MRLTVRHHFDFGADRAVVGDDLVRPEAWDALRTQTSGAFALAETREEWERTADEHPELEARARRLDEVFARRGAAKVVSYGVGGATLECWLKRVAPRARPRRHRLRAGHDRAAAADLRRGRVRRARPVGRSARSTPTCTSSTGSTRSSTTGAGRRCSSGSRRVPIVFVAAGQVDLRGALAEVRKGRRRGASRAGWVRTRGGDRGALAADAHGRRPWTSATCLPGSCEPK